MTSLLSCLLPASKPASTSSGKHVTDAPDIPRTEIGPASTHLKRELLDFYWVGVERELPHILLTLRKWQTRDDYVNTVLPDEEDTFIHGFDTFLDQVSHSSRQFSERITEPPGDDGLPTYEEALQNRGWDFFSEMKSSRIRTAIRDSLSLVPVEDIQRRRARMLLQSAQFLDIDKVIEYREPEKLLSFWKRPGVPQLAATSCDEVHMPILIPQICTECHSTIRSSVFRAVGDDSIFVCETCYRQNHYGHTGFTKHYKTCCLAEVVTPEMSRKICHCPSIPRRDKNGRLRPLWPFEAEVNDEQPGDRHICGDAGKVKCGLRDLTDMVAEAKYGSTRLKAEKNSTLEAVLRRDTREEEMAALMKGQIKNPKNGPSKLKNMNTRAVSEFGSSYGLVTETPEDIPAYLRSVTDKYPYGNVHMGLRIGPLIIENGVANTHGGVLITSRDPPKLQVLRDSPPDIEHSLLVAGKTDRILYTQHRPRNSKRYKAMMKQVVGGAFCGFFEPASENDIIDTLLEESQNMMEDGISITEKASMLEASTKRLLVKLQAYLSSRIDVYISTIVARLLDPNVALRWHFQSNNCQTFCDNLVDRNIFGSFFAAHAPEPDKDAHKESVPLYLMSFVCRPGAYIKEKTKSKFDVPNGLTEEYLLKFRYGRHDESDLIDSLAEYWYDWGAFEKPVYPYQDVFPWDCTEAYGRYPVRCGECNISKHVWAFPFDSWSIISLHLARGRQLYPKDPGAQSSSKTSLASGHMSDLDWFRNRLTILLGQDALLNAAVAMARCGAFRESTLWLHRQPDETRDRLKLGGIHRAQPFSHHFEKGAYHQYFIAEWASLSRPLRIAAYEKLRDWRATRADVGSSEHENNGEGVVVTVAEGAEVVVAVVDAEEGAEDAEADR